MTITTTLNAIRLHSPCEDGWKRLLTYLGKTEADNEPLKFSTILKSNGLGSALWCLRSLPEEYNPKIKHLGADFAERVLHLFEEKYPGDKRPREAIQAARDFADGKIDTLTAHAAANAARAAAANVVAHIAAHIAAHVAAHAAATTYTAADTANKASDTVFSGAFAARVNCAKAVATERKAQAKLLIKYFG